MAKSGFSVTVRHSNPGWAGKLARRLNELAGNGAAAGFPRGSAADRPASDDGASVARERP